jgi:hypothetical protein
MDEKKRVSLAEVLADIQDGLSDRELMRKHGLSAKQLDKVYEKLVESGRMAQTEVDARKDLLDDVLEFDEVPLEESQAPVRAPAITAEPDRPALPPPPGSGNSLPPQPENWQKKATLGIILGIVLAILGGIVPAIGSEGVVFRVLGGLMWLTGTGLQIWGCYYLAKGKGYHGAFSMLGVMCCLGLLILLVLPNKYGDARTSGVLIVLIVAIVLMVSVALMGIILAIAIPYYVSYKRTSCDRAASADVGKLSAALERLGNEVVDRNLRFDEEAVSRIADANALQYLVGPYYGFRGGTEKCSVLIRMNRHQGKWVVEGSSMKGSHPAGLSSRYIYRVPMAGGNDLPATVGRDPINARNGHSLDWNAYPYAPGGQPETCYTESIVGAEGPSGNQRFSVTIPKGVPCSTFLKK